MKRDDKRRNNGSENRGLTEDSQLVRGPAELLQAMRDVAKVERRNVTEIWRMAAEQFLEERKRET